MLGELFDPAAGLLIEEHCRPHWSQAGAVVFVTFRTKDSIPREVIQRWHQEKLEWFQVRGIACSSIPDSLNMPNHLHLLAAFHSEETMRQQFDSWLHWTATKINRKTGQRGHFWQEEPFDHLVRSPEQYLYLRDYIRDNPKKAKLNEGEHLYRRLEGG